jgi:hypothetical protein
MHHMAARPRSSRSSNGSGNTPAPNTFDCARVR